MKKIIVDARGSFTGGGVEILQSFEAELQHMGYPVTDVLFILDHRIQNFMTEFKIINLDNNFIGSIRLSILIFRKFKVCNAIIFSWGMPKIFSRIPTVCLLHNTIAFERKSVTVDFGILDRIKFFWMKCAFCARTFLFDSSIIVTSDYFYNIINNLRYVSLADDSKSVVKYCPHGFRAELNWKKVRPLKVSGPLKIVSVASFSPHKRMPVLVKSVESLLSDGFDIEFCNFSHRRDRIIEREISELVERSLVLSTDNCRFYFQKTHADVLAAVAEADIVLFLSTTESGPLALIEAAELGCLVVSTDASFISEFLVLPSECLVEQFSVRGVVRTLSRLLTKFYKLRGVPRMEFQVTSDRTPNYSREVLEHVIE